MTNGNDIGWQLDNSYLTLPAEFYGSVALNVVSNPHAVMINRTLATELGLEADLLHSEEAVAIFAGNKMPEGAAQIAQAYAGHQFGHFNMLGDGRALLIGEQITPTGERFDIQLKGAGRTPFSRGGDGRAALGPMLREFIISEAMHALNIPTTRSLAVVTTGEPVYRETPLEGAIVTRVAASHIRVGTFQYAINFCSEEELKELADYVIARHYPELAQKENPYIAFLDKVMARQAALVASWQLVGFIHGVMNTDNMTVSGETIDYGPCAFMDTYDPDTVFSSIDSRGRYAYSNQPLLAGWNLARFAETLVPLIHEDRDKAIALAQHAIQQYQSYFDTYWLAGMRKKLGLLSEEEGDLELVEQLLSVMAKYEADFTNTFRALSENKRPVTNMFESEEFKTWETTWQERLTRQDATSEEVLQVMQATNPAVIPRNHRVEEALEAATEKHDFSKVEKLLNILSTPFTLASEHAYYADLPEQDDRPYMTYCGT